MVRKNPPNELASRRHTPRVDTRSLRVSSVVRSSHDHFTAIAWPLRRSYTTVERPLHGRCVAVTRPLHSLYTTATWSLHVCSITRPLHDRYVTIIRPLQGRYMAVIWLLHGRVTADTRLLKGRFTTVTRPLHALGLHDGLTMPTPKSFIRHHAYTRHESATRPSRVCPSTRPSHDSVTATTRSFHGHLQERYTVDTTTLRGRIQQRYKTVRYTPVTRSFRD